MARLGGESKNEDKEDNCADKAIAKILPFFTQYSSHRSFDVSKQRYTPTPLHIGRSAAKVSATITRSVVQKRVETERMARVTKAMKSGRTNVEWTYISTKLNRLAQCAVFWVLIFPKVGHLTRTSPFSHSNTSSHHQSSAISPAVSSPCRRISFQKQGYLLSTTWNGRL